MVGKEKDKHKITPEERQLFRESIAKEIPTQAKKHALPSEEKKPKQPEDYHLSEFESQATVSSNAVISYKDPSINSKIFSDLKMGKLSVQAELDLHGMIVDEAHDALQNFIHKAQQKRLRCVRIIHGKGHAAFDQPILKNKVNNWLRQLHCVLAFCSATPRDGGTGAVYVLLRR